MKSLPISIAFSLLLSLKALASARQSASYSVSAETHDSGGAIVASETYRNLGSVGVIGGFSSASPYAVEPGYPAQIGGLPAPVIEVEQPDGNVMPDGGHREFGVSVIGSPVVMNFTIHNTGSAKLVISGSSFGGTHDGDFAAGPPDDAEIEPGSTATLSVTFTPGAAGLRNATFTLLSNAADDEFEITLSGTGNTPPTFAGYAVSTAYETAATVSWAKVLSKAADADGDALLANPASDPTQGGMILNTPLYLIYTPPPGFTGVDTFTVSITDARGATVNGTLSVSVGANPTSGGQGANTPLLTMLPGGDVGIAFQGIPGRPYQVQRSTNLSSWTTIATVTAAANGAVTFTDEDPPPGSGYYRLIKP